MRRLSDLRRAQPGDSTLQSLLEIMVEKLDLCARLPVCEYEARSQGHESGATAFRRLAEVERQSFHDLLVCLREHLDQTAGDRAPAPEGQT